MFCPNCGIKLPDDMVFCPECGTKISDGFAESNDKPAPKVSELKENDKNAEESIRKPSGIDRIKGIVGIALGIIAIILVIAISTGKLDKLAYELGLAGRPDSMKGIESDTTKENNDNGKENDDIGKENDDNGKENNASINNETESNPSEKNNETNKTVDKQVTQESDTEDPRDYRDYLDWNGYYTGGWMDTSWVFKLMSDYDSGLKCGVITDNFRGMDSQGFIFDSYEGNGDYEFTVQIDYEGSGTKNYLVYPKKDKDNYLLEVYDQDGNHECTFTRDMTYEEFGINDPDVEKKSNNSESANNNIDDLIDGLYTSTVESEIPDRIQIAHENGEPCLTRIYYDGVGNEYSSKLRWDRDSSYRDGNRNYYVFFGPNDYSCDLYKDGKNIVVNSSIDGEYVYLRTEL